MNGSHDNGYFGGGLKSNMQSLSRVNGEAKMQALQFALYEDRPPDKQ